jgi:hypothetical protein
MHNYHKGATEVGDPRASTEVDTVRPTTLLPPKPLPAETIKRIREEVADHRRESASQA